MHSISRRRARFAVLGLVLELDAALGIERLVGGCQLAQGSLARLEPLSQRDLLLRGEQLVVSDLAQVHRARTAGQLFGQQPEAADRLGGRGSPSQRRFRLARSARG